MNKTKSIEQQLKETKLKRWRLAAEREKQELSLNKIKAQEKMRNLCRIDLALDVFNDFLKEFVQMMLQFPDTVQRIVPSTTPEEYRDLQDFIDKTIQRLKEKQIHLAIESTQEQKEKATAKWYDSMSK